MLAYCHYWGWIYHLLNLNSDAFLNSDAVIADRLQFKFSMTENFTNICYNV